MNTRSIKKLATKRTWIRNGMEGFLGKWAEETSTIENISAEVLVLERHNGQYTETILLQTGCRELQIEFEVEKKDVWIQNISIEDLKEIIANLPNAITEIEKKINTEIREKITFPTWEV